MNASEISSEIRCVSDVADYFDELKGVAVRLTESISPSNRGYFTPDEEQHVQGLLISYWQARCALFELIVSFRLDDDRSDERRPDAFLTAFAAALVLIDAARFLRETVHDRPLLRDKLNEPVPAFGIPEGLYKRVQRSLVSTHHAWHLYHAIEYFEKNESSLRQLAAGSPLQPMLDLIDRLKYRLDISVTRFARVKLRTRSMQLVREITHGLFGRALYGLQKCCGNLMADKYVRLGHCPALPPDVARELKGCLRPGDVILARKEYALTNYFLPGYWPHAALYLGDAAMLNEIESALHPQALPRWRQFLETACIRDAQVLEAMKDGVFVRGLRSPFAADSALILRPRIATGDLPLVLDRALSHAGKRYDFDFDFRRSDRLVCTEVIYRALDGIGRVQLALTIRAGRPTLSGSDLIAMAMNGTNFDTIAVFAPLLADGILTGTQAAEVVRTAQGDRDTESSGR